MRAQNNRVRRRVRDGRLTEETKTDCAERFYNLEAESWER